MKHKKTRVNEVVTALGGPTKLAKRLGTSVAVVCNWTSQGRFPDKVSTLVAMRAACLQKGVELEERLFLK